MNGRLLTWEWTSTDPPAIRIPSDDLIDLDNEVAQKANLLCNDPAHDGWDRARYAPRVAVYEKCLRQGGTELDCQAQLQPRNTRK